MPRSVKELVITLAGHHGSGRTTNAKGLANSLGLRYISTGMLFRERAEALGVSLEEMNRLASNDREFDNWLDNRTKEESRKRGIVIDASLSAWMAEDPDLRVYVTCPFEIRVKRMADREGREYDEVEQETRAREALEQTRYQEYYDVDISDLSIYDVILNTGIFSIEASARILKNIVEEYVSGV
ncbi:AAA family ATPase [Candidatus Bathyarchaeota archaeon]|jgi:CMP/dCMP kinase|nr:AAA family ATPase [Candidatus Bathyarchaeota archaeon]MBT4319792.1 AAA family ATPase [Candidatus Bathyarchaeota archaeon]MBT4424785.1 AAA family ATPase [Candidatus Bathyarchaeota archaeon]MBT5641605.1 AAA family ATPase [Candidatus Bathyarchaeota archaeon]MBT6604768.1 AAA family ATPase [Candidatus Bathyarchaeota archaeon]